MAEATTSATLDDLGEEIAQIKLDIDYKIIEHFSEHLYGSPNKAVEELVSNGFDAFAQNTYVYIPGPYTSSHVIVWDDGWSMDKDGLQHLWWIARSPKDVGDRIAAVGEGDARRERKQIGKFGIGKLASYSVGDTIVHLCRRDDEFLLVSVDYSAIHGEKEQQPASKNEPVYRPISRLSDQAARGLLTSIFDGGEEPEALRSLFEKPTWTVAIIGKLKKGLSQGRLGWVLGNGMPLRPDFKVWVNDAQVVPRLEKDAIVEWDFGAEEVEKALRAEWKDAADDPTQELVQGELRFERVRGLAPADHDTTVATVEFPNLGRVWGTIRLFGRSVATGRPAEHGRSHGFFLYVRGRLLNEDDDKVLLHEPSYGTFYLSQFLLNVDGLDTELLADRERLRQDTSTTAELRILQVALYLAARAKLNSILQEKEDKAKSESLLPIRSREFFREPLTALIMRSDEPAGLSFNLGHPEIKREPLGDDKPAAVLTPEGFRINVSHPYFRALERRIGSGKKAQEFLRAYDMFAISDRLLEGHLYDVGLSDDTTRQVMDWKEGLIREMAENYDRAPSDLAMELINSSYQGKEEFENAIAKVLHALGFRAERFGSPGEKDILLAAAIGPESYRFTFEGKGRRGKPLPNDDAEVGGAIRHRDDADAEHAVIVAREFAGFKSPPPGGPAILGECRSAGGVSIMQVDALIELMAAVDEFGYPLDMLKEVFVALESPEDKLSRIRQLRAPTEDFNYREVLEDIWERQGRETGFGDAVPYKTVYREREEWRTSMDFDSFERKLVALETLARGRIRLMTTPREIFLLQNPEIIAEHVERSWAARATGV